MWFLFQIAIMTLIIGSNGAYHWAPKGGGLAEAFLAAFAGQAGYQSQPRKAARVSGGFACPSKRHCRSINSPSSCRWSASPLFSRNRSRCRALSSWTFRRASARPRHGIPRLVGDNFWIVEMREALSSDLQFNRANQPHARRCRASRRRCFSSVGSHRFPILVEDGTAIGVFCSSGETADNAHTVGGPAASGQSAGLVKT